MFRKIPYVESERQIIGERPGFQGMGTVPIYNTPVSPKENLSALLDEKHPFWMPGFNDSVSLHPDIYNNTLGRGSKKDICDAFGVNWKYEPTVGGSISVSGGKPLLEDVNDWKEKIKFPDIDSWDWEQAAKDTPIDSAFPTLVSLVNGFWFERLISFMDFMPAAMALIDEEQEEAIKELFAATTDFACSLVSKFCEYWPQLAIIETHDDWGSQMAPFFSKDVAYELFVPYMKQFTDCVHAHGRYAFLHSCGHNAERIQCFIDGGFDMWAPQTMNDIGKLYDEYGDKILLSVWPEETNLSELSEGEQIAAARRFVDRFCKPGKPSMMGINALRRSTPAFNEEVYRYSREKYLSE